MSNKSSFKKAHQYAQTGDGDFSLFAKLKELEHLNQLMGPLLPAECQGFCQVANVTGRTLILIAANGAIATQIRFLKGEILAQMKQHPTLSLFQDLQCKVRLHAPPSAQPRASRTRQKREVETLSPHTAALITDMAESIEDPHLREVMKRIAQRTKK